MKKTVSVIVRLMLAALVLAGLWFGWTLWRGSKETPMESRYQFEEVRRQLPAGAGPAGHGPEASDARPGTYL